MLLQERSSRHKKKVRLRGGPSGGETAPVRGERKERSSERSGWQITGRQRVAPWNGVKPSREAQVRYIRKEKGIKLS